MIHKVFEKLNQHDKESVFEFALNKLLSSLDKPKPVKAEPPSLASNRGVAVEINGVTYKSIASAARVHNLKVASVHYHATQRGITAKDAILYLVSKKKQKIEEPTPPIELTIGGDKLRAH